VAQQVPLTQKARGGILLYYPSLIYPPPLSLSFPLIYSIYQTDFSRLHRTHLLPSASRLSSPRRRDSRTPREFSSPPRARTQRAFTSEPGVPRPVPVPTPPQRRPRPAAVAGLPAVPPSMTSLPRRRCRPCLRGRI
jgi:hypothetical protein